MCGGRHHIFRPLPVRALVVAARPEVAKELPSRRRAAACCDAGLVEDHARVDAVAEALDRFPPAAGPVDEMLNEAIRHVTELAAVHFKRLPGTKRKDWISDGTWQLAHTPRRALNRQLAEAARVRKALPEACLSCWLKRPGSHGQAFVDACVWLCFRLPSQGNFR